MHRVGTFCFPFAALFCLSAASCTDLMIAKYRDEPFLEDHHYVLCEQYLTVDGLRFCYQERGQGPDVVIFPGLATSIDFWQLTIPALAEHYHVTAVDLPGFGKSDKPDVDYDLNWLRDRLIAFMDARHIRRANLIGGSMGGHLALLIALLHPDRVDKIVLQDSSGTWPEPGPIAILGLFTLWNDPVVTDHLRRNWPDIFHKMFIRQTPVTERIFRYQMAVRADAARYAPEGRASTRALRSIFFHTCRGKLEQIRQPTLIVWGQHDQIHLFNEADYFRAHLPDSRLVIIEDAAHEVMIDQPETFNRLVLQFLEDGTQAIHDGRI